jgi:hypothetical protein
MRLSDIDDEWGGTLGDISTGETNINNSQSAKEQVGLRPGPLASGRLRRGRKKTQDKFER